MVSGPVVWESRGIPGVQTTKKQTSTCRHSSCHFWLNVHISVACPRPTEMTGIYTPMKLPAGPCQNGDCRDNPSLFWVPIFTGELVTFRECTNPLGDPIAHLTWELVSNGTLKRKPMRFVVVKDAPTTHSSAENMRVFPKIVGTPKLMVYNGKPY